MPGRPSSFCALSLFFLIVGFAAGFATHGPVFRQAGMIIGIILVGGFLLLSSQMRSYLLSSFGLKALSLAFLVVADRRAQRLRRRASLAADEQEATAPREMTAREAWLTIGRVMAVFLGIGMALGLQRAVFPMLEVSMTLDWIVHFGVLVAMAILASPSGLLNMGQPLWPPDRGVMAKPGPSPSLDPDAGPDGRL